MRTHTHIHTLIHTHPMYSTNLKLAGGQFTDQIVVEIVHPLYEEPARVRHQREVQARTVRTFYLEYVSSPEIKVGNAYQNIFL